MNIPSVGAAAARVKDLFRANQSWEVEESTSILTAFIGLRNVVYALTGAVALLGLGLTYMAVRYEPHISILKTDKAGNIEALTRINGRVDGIDEAVDRNQALMFIRDWEEWQFHTAQQRYDRVKAKCTPMVAAQYDKLFDESTDKAKPEARQNKYGKEFVRTFNLVSIHADGQGHAEVRYKVKTYKAGGETAISTEAFRAMLTFYIDPKIQAPIGIAAENFLPIQFKAVDITPEVLQ